MSTRYPTPWRQVDEGEEIVAADGRHVAFADSRQAAAEIVNLANTAHAAAENTRRFLEQGRREVSPL